MPKTSQNAILENYFKVMKLTEALLKKYGEWMEFPRTGMRGSPQKLILIDGTDLKYAQVIKK